MMMMENSQVKRKPSMSLYLFTTFSESFSSSSSSSSSERDKFRGNSSKSPRNFEGGVVGLGIVAAMTDSARNRDSFSSVSPNTARSNPIAIVSSAKPAANFKGRTTMEVDENSEGYTCVISHFAGNAMKKRVYFDSELDNSVDDFGTNDTASSTCGVFSTSPVNFGDPPTRFWSADFLSSCNLCNKQLHGVDIFIYRGERAFCSAECRETHIRNEDHCQEKCKSGAMKSLDCSMSPCSGPPVSFAGIVAA